MYRIGSSKISQKTYFCGGFTLVELMLAISTVAILSLIAYLAMGGFRESAQDSKRLSDLTSLSSAIDTFIQSHGAAPEPSNPKQVTFSGANIWMQGVIDDSVTQRIGNVDPGKKDTDYGTYYTYSVLNSGKEFQLGTVIQTEDGTTAGYFPLSTALADNGAKLTKALALTKGNYNGILARTRSGDSCDTIALPSIILSQLSAGSTELKATGTGVLVIDKEGNIPASYQGTSIFGDGNEVFRSFNDPQVSLDQTRTCDLNSIFNGATSENSLLALSESIKHAYENTPIAKQADTKYYEIANTPFTDTGAQLDFAKKVVINVIGEEVRSSPTRADAGCSLQPNIPYGTGYYNTGATQPDQIWKYWNGAGPQPGCSFQCVENYAWDNSKRLCQETRLFECGKTIAPDKPERSYWTSGSGYTQRWNVSLNKWIPVDSIPEYNIIPTDDTCYFSCDDGYTLSPDGKKCVKNCSVQSRTINFHNYYTPEILGGTTVSVTSEPVDIMASCAGNNIEYAQNFNCSIDGELTATGTESIKAINCGTNYYQNELTCKSDTRYTTCGLYVPVNSINNSRWINDTLENTHFKQTWKCSNWDPEIKNFDHVPAGGGQCTFVCNPGYTWSPTDRMCKPSPCITPWGIEIPSVPDGYTGTLAPYRVRAFLTNSVPSGETCTSEFRLCTKGVLSGTYQHPSCTVDAAQDCASRVSAINGHSYNVPIMANGQVSSWPSQRIYIDEQCNNLNYAVYSQTFTCNNGVVGTSGAETETITCTTGYTASGSTCVANTGSGSCAGTIPTNASASTPTTYDQVFSCADNALIPTYTWTHAALTCGFECDSGYTWNETQQKCLPNSCALPWGGTISSGSGITAYASSNTLKWKEVGRSFTMNCKGINPCSDYVGSCSTAGQTTRCDICDATPNPSTGWYEGFLVTKSCSYDCASETRTCTNGVLSGTYTNPTCSTAKVCRGTLPAAHATFCSGDTTGLTVDTDISQVVNCTAGTKCEYQCTGGYTGANCDVPPPLCDLATQVYIPDTLVCKGADGLEHGSCTTEGAKCSYTAYNNSPTLVDSALVYLDTVSFKYIDGLQNSLVEKAEAMCYLGNEADFRGCSVGQRESCRPCSDGNLLCRCIKCTNSCPYGYADPGDSCTCSPAPTVGTCMKKPGHCQDKVAGVCGDRATSYLGAQANWGVNVSYCATGTVTPTAPAYPAPSTTTTWTCNGLYGGDSVSCSATRGSRPTGGKCSCMYYEEFFENCPSGVRWECSDNSAGGCYGEAPSCTTSCVEECVAPDNVASCVAADGSIRCFSGYPLGWHKPGDLGCESMPGYYASKDCSPDPDLQRCSGGPSIGGGYCYCCSKYGEPKCVGPGAPLPC